MPLGARVAVFPARVLGSGAGRVIVAYLLVALAFNLAHHETPARQDATAATPAKRARKLPPGSPEGVPVPDTWPEDFPYEELESIDDPPPAPPKAAPVVRERPLPGGADVASVESDAWPALAEALSLAPPPSQVLQADLTRFAIDPHVTPSESAERWARDCEPALVELERAAQATSLVLPVGGDHVDVGRLNGLAAAALLSARARARSGTPGLAAHRALVVVRVGHALMGQPRPEDAASGAALARMAERWLESSLNRDDWSAEELAWLRARFVVLQRARPARSQAAGPTAGAATWIEEKLALMLADEARTFERLLLGCTAALEPKGGGK